LTTGQRSRKPVDCGRAGQAQSPGQIGATGERRRALFFMQCHETENDGHWDRLHDAKSIVPAPAKIFKDMAPFTQALMLKMLPDRFDH